MLLRLLKHDLMNEKVMNAVMIVFICVSALLSSTSITLLYSSTHMISSFLKAGNVADQNMFLYNVSKDQQNEIRYCHG